MRRRMTFIDVYNDVSGWLIKMATSSWESNADIIGFHRGVFMLKAFSMGQLTENTKKELEGLNGRFSDPNPDIAYQIFEKLNSDPNIKRLQTRHITIERVGYRGGEEDEDIE
jgi:hypothetical protein